MIDRQAFGVVALAALVPFVLVLSFAATPATPLDLAEACAWTGGTAGPSRAGVLMTPVVADVDRDGWPDIVFTSDGPAGGILRMVSGRDCRETLGVARLAGSCAALQPPEDGFLCASCGLAVGEIDGDPELEIVGLLAWRSGQGQRVVALDPDGSVQWCSEPWAGGAAIAQPALADLDGNGRPEIVVGDTVFDASGRLLWSASAPTQFPSVAADLDGDGLLDVVTGDRALRGDGSLLWLAPERSGQRIEGFPAVADVDLDGRPEVVFSVPIDGGISVLDGATGRLRAETGPYDTVLEACNCTSWTGGPPTLADVDGDRVPEAVIVGGLGLAMFRFVAEPPNGLRVEVAWEAPNTSCDWSIGGATLEDLDGDGHPEVLVRDNEGLWALDARTGALLAHLASASAVGGEYPVVADVDSDGDAEIVIGADPFAAGGGLQVVHDPSARWAAARRIANQHSYHVTNVCDDGTIPARERDSWTWANSYRAQGVLSACPSDLPRITAPPLRRLPEAGERRRTLPSARSRIPLPRPSSQ